MPNALERTESVAFFIYEELCKSCSVRPDSIDSAVARDLRPSGNQPRETLLRCRYGKVLFYAVHGTPAQPQRSASRTAAGMPPPCLLAPCPRRCPPLCLHRKLIRPIARPSAGVLSGRSRLVVAYRSKSSFSKLERLLFPSMRQVVNLRLINFRGST
eukprot:6211143-Pleurochrysis_carterae.AAC.3